MVRRAQLDIVITGDDADLRRALNKVNKQLAGVGQASARMGRKVSRGTGMAGRGFQNLGFQVGDFATQVGAGTSASIALGQQLPQLLGGFGALGAVLGAVVAVAVPLTRAMGEMGSEADGLTRIFGELEPAAMAIADGFGAIRDIGIQMADVIINNLDRFLITGGVVAGFFAGKWVVSFAAARIATFSLVGALTALRTALIRTGIGAIVIGLGEAVYQFTRLTRAAGGFGEALGLVQNLAIEVFGRIAQGFELVPLAIKAGAASMKVWFLTAIQDMLIAFQDLTWQIAGGLNNLFGTSLQGADLGATDVGPGGGGLGSAISAATGEQYAAQGQMGAVMGNLTGPLKSLEEIRAVLASIKDDRIDLPSLLGTGGDEEDGDGGGEKGRKSKLEQYLDRQKEALRDFYETWEMIQSDNLGASAQGWSDYFNNLINLTGSSNDKLLQMGKVASATAAFINAWEAYSKTLAKAPWPLNIAAAANVLAAGIGAVNAIKGAGKGGGGRTSAGAVTSNTAGNTAGSVESSGAASVQQQRSLTLIGDRFNRQQAIQIAEFMNEGTDDGLVIRGRR